VKNQSIIGDAIADLNSDGVNITSIAGENHPVHVPFFAHWSMRCKLLARGGILNRISCQACLCHGVQPDTENAKIGPPGFRAPDATQGYIQSWGPGARPISMLGGLHIRVPCGGSVLMSP
jgi:hypothetical protein